MLKNSHKYQDVYEKLNLKLIAQIIVVFGCFYSFSGFLNYLICLFMPAYFTYRALNEKYSLSIQKNLLKYWILYGILNYPITIVLKYFLVGEMITNLLKIIIFSSFYHPKSRLLVHLDKYFEFFFKQTEEYLHLFSSSFFQGFNSQLAVDK